MLHQKNLDLLLFSKNYLKNKYKNADSEDLIERLKNKLSTDEFFIEKEVDDLKQLIEDKPSKSKDEQE